MRPYEYHVSYVFSGGGGSIRVECLRPANSSYDALDAIREYIASRPDMKGFSNISITGIIPIKKWWEFWR